METFGPRSARLTAPNPPRFRKSVSAPEALTQENRLYDHDEELGRMLIDISPKKRKFDGLAASIRPRDAADLGQEYLKIESDEAPTSSVADQDAVSVITGDPRCFYVKQQILGNDSVQPLQCAIDEFICDVCLEFVRSSLSAQDYRNSNERWRWKRCGDSASYLIFQHYTSRRKLEASAQAGCELCIAMLSSGILARQDSLVFADINSRSERSEDGVRGQKDYSEFYAGGLERFLKNGAAGGNDFEYEFTFAKDEEECLLLPVWRSDGGLPHALPFLHSESQGCHDLIADWYSKCANQHEKCSRRELALPLRILDVEPENGGPNQVVLRESKELLVTSGNTGYVALSYCWANISVFSTTKQNISGRLQGISFHELPAVVQNAVTVIRKLDIRYLWVDAFCICQDDQAEWEEEAARMADIYGGCVFTLSALSSANASTPFLQDRNFNPVHLGSATISYGTWEDDVQLFIRRKPRTIKSEIQSCPLSRRAWPLQERILAPAVLHYGRDQLIWECNENHLRSETGEENDWGGIVIRTSDMTGARYGSTRADLWEAIVEEFTSRQLTFASDRLPAILGIASRLRQDGTRNGRYVAGLWETDLEFGLLWRVRDGKVPETYYGSSVQPNLHISSWSWALRNVQVYCYWGSGATSVLCKPPKFCFDDSDDWDSDAQSQQSLKTVSSCRISLSGYLQRVGDTAIQVDSMPQRQTRQRASRYPGLPGLGSKFTFDCEPPAPGPYYCLRMAEASKKYPAPNRIDYLVLRQPRTGHPYEPLFDAYVRIGRLTLYGIDDQHFVQPYPDVLCTNGKPLLQEGEWKDIMLI